jgi:hypothetical protein
MYVDHSPGRKLEHLGPEDVAIGHDDAKIGLEASKACRKHITYGTYWLEYGYSRGEGGNFDRRGDQLRARSSLGLVRLGDDARDSEPALQQCLQRWHGESRSAEENDSHHSDRADAAWTSLV